MAAGRGRGSRAAAQREHPAHDRKRQQRGAFRLEAAANRCQRPQRAEGRLRDAALATRRSIFSRTSAAPCKPLFADATTMPMLADEPRHAETPMADADGSNASARRARWTASPPPFTSRWLPQVGRRKDGVAAAAARPTARAPGTRCAAAARRRRRQKAELRRRRPHRPAPSRAPPPSTPPGRGAPTRNAEHAVAEWRRRR